MREVVRDVKDKLVKNDTEGLEVIKREHTQLLEDAAAMIEPRF